MKGINFVSCLYQSQGVSLPVGFVLVRKTERYTDHKDGKEKRCSDKTKNGMYRDLLQQAVKNQIPLRKLSSWDVTNERDTLPLEPIKLVTVYLEGVEFALLLVKQVFTNEDGSIGIQYLVTSDTTSNGNGIAAINQNDGTRNPITNRSSRMLRWRNHRPKRW